MIKGRGSIVLQFAYPINFVYGRGLDRWSDVMGDDANSDPERMQSRFTGTDDIWIVQTYLRLRRRGMNVSLTEEPVRNGINVITNSDIRVRQFPIHCYIVAIRADTFAPMLCHHSIFQNASSIRSGSEHFIPHWPQPGLIPRDEARGETIEFVTYNGGDSNLYDAFRDEAFRRRLASIGVELRLNTAKQNHNDYSDADITLAVRDLTEFDFQNKPASKLVNAWHAGSPALLGPEPGFRELRKSELDFFEVSTADEAIAAIKRLKETPGLHRAMVRNGLERAQDFTPERVADRWCEVLDGPVSAGFREWSAKPAIWRATVRPVAFAIKSFLHMRSKKNYRFFRDHGFRPISGRTT